MSLKTGTRGARGASQWVPVRTWPPPGRSLRAEGTQGPSHPGAAASLQAGPRARAGGWMGGRAGGWASVEAARGQPDPGGRRPSRPSARYLCLGAARRVPPRTLFLRLPPPAPCPAPPRAALRPPPRAARD